MTLKALIGEAEKLTRAEQAELLDELIRLLGPEEPDVALTPAQQQDLARRAEEYRAGRATLILGDEAVQRLRKRT